MKKKTLSELIASLGSDFHMLLNNIHEWKATSADSNFGRGKTPEEAVMNLMKNIKNEDRLQKEVIKEFIKPKPCRGCGSILGHEHDCELRNI